MTFTVDNSVEFHTAVDGEQYGRTNTYGVISGCGLTESTIDMAVTVASGFVKINGVVIAVTGDDVTLVSDPSNLRWNIVVADTTGAPDMVLGDAAPDSNTEPSKPPIGDDQVVLKEYKVNAAASIANDITVNIEKRVPIDTPLVEGPIAATAPGSIAMTTLQHNTNTVMAVGAVLVPFDILASQFMFNVTAVGTAGTLGIALFSNDGQTKVFDLTTASLSGTGVKTQALAAPTFIKRGLYYVAVNPDGTCDVTVTNWTTGADPFDEAASAGLNELSGTITVTAGTIPATMDPDAITYAASKALAMRIN